MKLGINSRTFHNDFNAAIHRIRPQIQVLKSELAQIVLPGRYDNLMLSFVADIEPDVVRVTKRGRDDDIYEAEVGFDSSGTYPADEDVLVIQMLEEKLTIVVETDEGFAPRRDELVKTIVEWTTKVIMP